GRGQAHRARSRRSCHRLDDRRLRPWPVDRPGGGRTPRRGQRRLRPALAARGRPACRRLHAAAAVRPALTPAGGAWGRVRYAGSIETTRWSSATASPTITWTAATTPPTGASIGISIFMLSTSSKVSPWATVSPGATSSSNTLPATSEWTSRLMGSPWLKRGMGRGPGAGAAGSGTIAEAAGTGAQRRGDRGEAAQVAAGVAGIDDLLDAEGFGGAQRRLDRLEARLDLGLACG